MIKIPAGGGLPAARGGALSLVLPVLLFGGVDLRLAFGPYREETNTGKE
jgi:hypothetical protein